MTNEDDHSERPLSLSRFFVKNRSDKDIHIYIDPESRRLPRTKRTNCSYLPGTKIYTRPLRSIFGRGFSTVLKANISSLLQKPHHRACWTRTLAAPLPLLPTRPHALTPALHEHTLTGKHRHGCSGHSRMYTRLPGSN